MISFYRWTVRLSLLVALYLLLLMFQAIWPTERSASWIELGGIGALAVVALSVSLWAVGAWMGRSISLAARVAERLSA